MAISLRKGITVTHHVTKSVYVGVTSVEFYIYKYLYAEVNCTGSANFLLVKNFTFLLKFLHDVGMHPHRRCIR